MKLFSRWLQFDRIESAVKRLESAFETLLNQSELITMADLAAITESINAQAALIANVKATLEDVQAKLAAALASGTDQAAIDALQATVDANNAVLTALVPPAPQN